MNSNPRPSETFGMRAMIANSPLNNRQLNLGLPLQTRCRQPESHFSATAQHNRKNKTEEIPPCHFCHVSFCGFLLKSLSSFKFVKLQIQENEGFSFGYMVFKTANFIEKCFNSKCFHSDSGFL